MRRQTYLILAAVADEPRHGYGIIRRVEEVSKGHVRLGPGTLYGALDRLANQGSIAPDREEVHEGRRRRFYRLTDQGREELAAELQQRRRDVAIGHQALGPAT